MADYFDNIRNFLTQNPMFPIDPIGSTLRNVIANRDAEVQQQWQAGRPDEQFQQAMIPRKENIAQFLKAVMKSDVPASIVKKYPDLGTALSIAEARYPNQMTQAKIGGPIKIEPHNNQDYGGFFSPKNKQITLVAHPTGNKVEDAYHMMKNYMNIALHEAAHADQYLRKSNRADPTELLVHDSPLLKPGQVGTYITPEASRLAVGNNSLYRNQPVEVDAFRRGKIAEDTISELSDLLPKVTQRAPFSPKENVNFSGDAPPLNEEMQKLASFFNRAIKAVKSNKAENPEVTKNMVSHLKFKKNEHLEEMKWNAEYDKNMGRSGNYQQFDEANVYTPENIFADSIAKLVKQRIAPLADMSPKDLQMNSLIRKVQDVKGVGPMAEWLKTTLNIESLAKRDANDAAVRAQKALDFQRRREASFKSWRDKKNAELDKLFPGGFK